MKHLTSQDEQMARQMIGLLDLTSLNAKGNEQRIIEICQRAVTPVGLVAAVCVYPNAVQLARRTLNKLHGETVRVAAVVNHPYCKADIETAVTDTRIGLVWGADEIELMYPHRQLLTGDRQNGKDMVSACRSACGDRAVLKVVLDTGHLKDPQLIRKACEDIIAAGADFIDTHSDKAIIGASSQAARIILEVIAEIGGQGGLKVTAGMRTFEEARVYLELARSRFGPHWVNANHVRFGGASLRDDLLMGLGVLAPGG
ncbi:deoxyribose-phosphate aldolase [Pseudomonas sp. NA-150]|uniref:deoxyribose-phosphate aldolase n=1 Tax=Pseudomonas sp. NA-150 TaxID=3367525 RepID=UPI0037C8298F